jgi:hypothetical protein
MKRKLLSSFLALIGYCGVSWSQTYDSDTLPRQAITSYSQSFTFSFTGAPMGAWGVARLVVYYNGDFGDGGENITVTDEDGSTAGTVGPYPSGSDCWGRDSMIVNINAPLIDAWLANNQIDFTLTISSQVDPPNCTNQYVQARLIYNYCAAGTPVQFAAFTLPEDRFCNYDDAIALSGTPAGGTFSGTNVSGNSFDPEGLAPGSSHVITYTATDAIGCTTTATQTVRIKRAPMVMDTVGCPGLPAMLTINQGGTFVWFEDPELTQDIDTGNMVMSAPIDGTTIFYVAALNSTSSFVVDSIGTTGAMVVDHNTTSGDDRGGIAITEDYIYVVGDNNTVRANASDLSNQVSLPIRDAIFSDLETGLLYTLWNVEEDTDPNYNNSTIDVTAIRDMNQDLALGSQINLLSSPVPVDYGSMILTGHGFVGIVSAANEHVYVIDLDDYSVTDLGVQSFNNYGSENWASWGVLEFDGDDFFALYRSNSGDLITRRNLTTGTESTLITFPGYVSDLSSFTISPWNNRWYFHYEGSGVFGGSTETMGYANAGSTTVLIEDNELGCYSEVEVFVNDIDLGPDTTVCQYNTPVILFAGLGYNSYTWNGVNNNYNAYAATAEGSYVVQAADDYNCTISDTITVTFDECLGVEENAFANAVQLYPNPTQGTAYLKIGYGDYSSVKCILTDLNGKVLSTFGTQLTAGENLIEVPAAELAPGVYMINVTAGESNSTAIRFIKQ